MELSIKATFVDMKDRGVECSAVVAVDGISNAACKRVTYGEGRTAADPTEAAGMALSWAVAYALDRIKVPPGEIR